MKSKDRTETPKVKEAVARSVDFEVTIADIARRSERRAWWVAGSASLLCLLLVASYFLVLPLKEKVPYMVMADAYTGTATIARLREDFSDNSITTSEAIARSNIAHYIQARESYDYDIMRLRDWATVNTMSAGDALASLKMLYSGSKSPYQIYGQSRALRVKINNIVPIGGNGEPYTGATVSFERIVFNKTVGDTSYLDSKIATMGFTYDPTLEMDDQARIANPLGFQVTTYRLDNDYSSRPPPETNAAQEAPPPGMVAPAAPGAQPSALPPGTVAPSAASPAATPVPGQRPATSNPNGANVP